MNSEFDVIKKYFSRKVEDVDLGIGDDAALMRLPSGSQLAVSTDMLIAGTHFFPDEDPFLVGWKSLAVNISDIAAMGGTPRWATLGLALPDIDPQWLQAFSKGFFACADTFQVALVGGDTTRGALNICVTIMGELPHGSALHRSGAKIGDDIWVSGILGLAALGLQHRLGHLHLSVEAQKICMEALTHPQPRVNLGKALRAYANSCLDVSDGLLADLGHILDSSGVGATIHLEKFHRLPFILDIENQSVQDAILSGGDDYELCFTAPSQHHNSIQALSEKLHLPLSCIGHIDRQSGLRVFYQAQPLNFIKKGYDHFA